MPAIPDRFSQEDAIAEALGRVQSGHRKELKKLLGDPPRLENVPADFWKKVDDEIAAAIYLLLMQSFTFGSLRLGQQAGLAFPTAEQVAGAAKRYAQARSTLLGRGMRQTTQKRIETKIRSGELTDGDLADILSPERAEDVAITETTKANSTAEMGTVRVWRSSGGVVTIIWRTERDGKVCRTCRKFEGKPESVWGRFFPDGPPAHPRCRCETEVIVVEYPTTI